MKRKATAAGTRFCPKGRDILSNLLTLCGAGGAAFGDVCTPFLGVGCNAGVDRRKLSVFPILNSGDL